MTKKYIGEEKRYYIDSNQVFYATGDDTGERLAQADAQTFMAFPIKDFKYAYSSFLSADQFGFYLARDFIQHKNAHLAKILAPYNHGDCMFLIISKNKLYRINQNEKKTEEIQTNADLTKLKHFTANHFYSSPKYFQDENFVYSFDIYKKQLTKLDNANLSAFKVFHPHNWENFAIGMDNKSVYVLEKIIKNADPKTFTYVGFGYAKDINTVFFLNYSGAMTLEDSDPSTFTQVDSEDNSFDAMDKKHRYKNGERVH